MDNPDNTKLTRSMSFGAGVATGLAIAICGTLFACSALASNFRGFDLDNPQPAHPTPTIWLTPDPTTPPFPPQDQTELRVTLTGGELDVRGQPETLNDFQQKLTLACIGSQECRVLGSSMSGDVLTFFIYGDSADTYLPVILPVIRSSIYSQGAELITRNDAPGSPERRTRP